MRAHVLFTPEGEARVRVERQKIVVECVVVTPPSAAEQTVWVDLSPDMARALRRRLGAALISSSLTA